MDYLMRFQVYEGFNEDGFKICNNMSDIDQVDIITKSDIIKLEEILKIKNLGRFLSGNKTRLYDVVDGDNTFFPYIIGKLNDDYWYLVMKSKSIPVGSRLPTILCDDFFGIKNFYTKRYQVFSGTWYEKYL